MSPAQPTVIAKTPPAAPFDAAAALQSALALHQQGELDQAQALYAQILAVQPEHLDALYLSGVLAGQCGHYAQGIQQLNAACAIDAKLPAIHTALGNLHRNQGQFASAFGCYQTALKLDVLNADTYYNLGVAYQECPGLEQGLENAVDVYQHAVAYQPNHLEAWNNLGVVLKTLGRLEEALVCYTKVLEHNPQHLLALFNLGVLASDAERFEEALDFYQYALAVQPDHVASHFNLGIAYRSLGRLTEALPCFERAITLQPNHIHALQNLGATHFELGQLAEAEGYYLRALKIKPDQPEVHYNLALSALAQGNYATGWPAFEWRWQGAETARQQQRPFAQPQWRGEDIRGKTILLHAEQGLGDTLQFIRYAPLVAQRGARVIVECQPALVRLLQASMPTIAQVIAAGEPLPDFAYHCPLMSLPGAFGTLLDNVPAQVPYLNVDPMCVQPWQQRLASLPHPHALKVGLVWAGNPREYSLRLRLIDQRRSLHLQQLSPLADCRDIAWISLQIGAAAQEARQPPTGMQLHDFTAHIHDFADTAALVDQLDLVISVDTSVAHLAGALNKPVWLLSRFDACWRWLRVRDDSPWYPSMRIFRQPSPGEWGPVLEQVATRLNSFKKTA